MNVYPLLLALTILFALIALWDSGLMAYPILAGFGFALMMTLRHYSGLWVIGHAAGTQSELLRSFLLRSSIKAETSSPLHLVGAAYAFNLNRFVFILAIALSGFSGGLTGEYEYHRPAAYYGQYSLFDLFGDIDLFAVAGTVAAIAVPIKALRFYVPSYRPRPIRRSASALHGESDWLPIRTAKSWFHQGGITVGEADRPDMEPKLGGQAPLLRYDGEAGSGMSSSSPVPAATRLPPPSCRPPWSGTRDWSASTPALEVFPRVYVARRNIGHRVVTLNPESRYSDGFNALD
jgi:hypothetical protein